MSDEIEQLKSVLRSLVVSSPTQVDVRRLLRDYRAMIGAPVPINKYGHREPVGFLKERFSDCFLFSGPPANPVLTLIVPDTLKHIDKFVQKQKVSSTARGNPKRRSVPEKLWSDFEKFKQRNGFSQSNVETNKSETKPPTTSEPHLTSNKTNGVKESQCNNKIVEDKKNIDKEVEYKPIDNCDKEENYKPIDSGDAVKNFLNKRLLLYNTSQFEDEEQSFEKLGKSIQDDDDSGRLTSSSGNSAKARQLEQLKSEIMELISDAPDGVWCTELIRLYRERYNRELNFTRFGYTSIISMLYGLDVSMQITRPTDTGDWLLRHSGAPPAPPGRARPRPPAPAPAHVSRRADPDDALPGIDFDPDVFPEDCMHFLESIESVPLGDFRPGAMVEVIIGEVYSPSHFWFIRLGENYNIAMEDMMDEMTRYYNGEGKERTLSRGAVRVGHYCSSLYERDWHRSLIVKIVDTDTVKVRHVDYGTVDTVSVSVLKPLRREWARLPAQAARARLGGVRPPAAGWRWPHAACAAFLGLVTNRRLVANIVALDQRDMVAEMLLIDTSSEEDVCIGSELIRAGHADSRPDSALRALDVYLYPRFEALEGGHTPNFAEIHAYLRDGIRLDCVSAFRAHVPPLLTDLLDRHVDRSLDHEHYQSLDQSLDYEHNHEHDQSLDQTHDESQEQQSHPEPEITYDLLPDLAPSEHDSAAPPVIDNDLDANKTEAATEPELSSRIPLLLPEPLLPSISQPDAKPEVDIAPSSPQPARRPPSSPTPTSYLSPDAPAYIPRMTYPTPPTPRQMYRPACPPPPGLGRPGAVGPPTAPGGAHMYQMPAAQFGGPPLPPSVTPSMPGVTPSMPGVTLSVGECETYRMLSHVNPAAAHWFMVGAMGRAMSPPVRPMQPMHPMHPMPVPMHPGPLPPGRIRPPPGFGT